MKLKSLPLFLTFALAGLCGVVAAAPLDSSNLRTTVVLDGSGWQTVTGTTANVPATGWQPATVPGPKFVSPKSDWAPQYAWYRRTLDIPADWSGKRIFVDVRGARNAPQVYIDSKLAGGQMNGWSPLRVEITSLVKPGASSSLAIRCQDRDGDRRPREIDRIQARHRSFAREHHRAGRRLS